MSDRAWLLEEPPRVWRERENDGLFIEIPGDPADRVWSTADEAVVTLPPGAIELVPVAELDRLRDVERRAQVYVMSGLCGDIAEHRREALDALVEVARTDRPPSRADQPITGRNYDRKEPQVMDVDDAEEGCTCEAMAGLCPVHAPDICAVCGYHVDQDPVR